jgi:glycosyltransferase involved in cell wall biosynthesis
MPTTSVIIPALNEAESIVQVLGAIPRQNIAEILVVDGGSTDGTPELALSHGARLIHEPRRGYGRACATGLAAAKGDFVVFLDADGADDPSYLPALELPLRQDEADLVLGSRLAGRIAPGAMPWHQHFGNWLAARFIRALYGVPLTDLSPFRAAQRNRLLDLDLREMTYGWPTEMIVRAARLGWRICEVPVPYRQRLGGRSKISGTLRGTLLSTYHILTTIFRYARA